MDSPYKPETTISKITLLSRKIASLAVSRVPKEYISPGGDNLTKKTRVLTNQIAEAISDIIDSHHDEVMDYVSESLMRSSTLEITYKASVRSCNGEIELTPERLSSYMRTVLRKWRNIPYRVSKKK